MKKTKTTQSDPLHIFVMCGKGEKGSGVWLQSPRSLAEEMLNWKAETVLHSSCGQTAFKTCTPGNESYGIVLFFSFTYFTCDFWQCTVTLLYLFIFNVESYSNSTYLFLIIPQFKCMPKHYMVLLKYMLFIFVKA